MIGTTSGAFVDTSVTGFATGGVLMTRGAGSTDLMSETAFAGSGAADSALAPNCLRTISI